MKALVGLDDDGSGLDQFYRVDRIIATAAVWVCMWDSVGMFAVVALKAYWLRSATLRCYGDKTVPGKGCTAGGMVVAAI